MSDVIFLGSLRAPVSEKAPLSVVQLANRAQQAANRIESDAVTIKHLKDERDKLIEIAEESMGWDWLAQAETDGLEDDPDAGFTIEAMQSLVDDLSALKANLTEVPDEVLDTANDLDGNHSGPMVPQDWVEAVENFVRKCDAGEARSTKSYNAFKELLSQIPGNSYGEFKTYTTVEEK